MRFMMLMIPNIPQQPEGWMPPPEAVERMGRYNKELSKAGVLLALDGLHPPASGARVSYDGSGGVSVKDGPFAESKEVVGGYWMIDVSSRDEAIEWARRVPGGPGDVVEVRQVFEFSDFPQEVQEAAGDLKLG
jgi:hypothetical protein